MDDIKERPPDSSPLEKQPVEIKEEPPHSNHSRATKGFFLLQEPAASSRLRKNSAPTSKEEPPDSSIHKDRLPHCPTAALLMEKDYLPLQETVLTAFLCKESQVSLKEEPPDGFGVEGLSADGSCQSQCHLVPEQGGVGRSQFLW